MTEHTFVISGNFLLDDHRATLCATELIENLTDEVSRRRHSWRRIEALASSLAQLAAAMVKLAAPPPPASEPH